MKTVLSKEELQKLYDDLGTIPKVASSLGKSRRAAQQLLKKNGVVVQPMGCYKRINTPLEALGGVEALRQKYQDIGGAALAESIGVSLGSIHYLLEKFNIPLKYIAADGKAWNSNYKYSTAQKGWKWPEEARQAFSNQKKILYASPDAPRTDFNKGKTWDQIFGSEKADVMRQSLINRMKQGIHSDTSIELALQSALTSANIPYQTQYRINFESRKFTLVDVFIEPNICVFADGDYWHSLPGNMARDLRNAPLLAAKGFKVLRFWEKDINKNLDKCISKILEVI